MRKVLAVLLLAGAATPALAAGGPRDTIRAMSDREDRREARADRSERVHVQRSDRDGDDGQQSQPVVQRGHHGGANDTAQPVVQVDSSGGGQAGERRFHHGVSSRIASGGQDSAAPVESGGGGEPAVQRIRRDGGANDGVRIHRGPRVVEAPHGIVEDRSAPTLRQSERRVPNVFRNRVPIVSSTPREGSQPPPRIENHRRTNWASWSTSHWRRDHRYNWQDHRRRHRSIFHLGFYSDPFGWGYRPYQIGWRLWPSYYSSRFWLNDPYQYRLPYAPPGYRWIRYYDDAILVDTWNGQVVDVIYNFFW